MDVAVDNSALQNVMQVLIEKAIAATRAHLDESDPKEFKIELEENIFDTLVEYRLAKYSSVVTIQGAGDKLMVTISLVMENGEIIQASNI